MKKLDISYSPVWVRLTRRGKVRFQEYCDQKGVRGGVGMAAIIKADHQRENGWFEFSLKEIAWIFLPNHKPMEVCFDKDCIHVERPADLPELPGPRG